MPTEPKKQRGRPPQAEEKPQLPQVPMIQTGDIPTLYANLASLSMSYNDLRVYLMEVSPKEVSVVSTGTTRSIEAHVQPRLCLVMTPEFARALRDSLSTTIASYEQSFGQLRNAPGAEAILKSLPKQ